MTVSFGGKNAIEAILCSAIVFEICRASACKGLLTEVTSGSVFRSPATHGTPISIANAKENTASLQRGGEEPPEKEVCVSDFNASDFMEDASPWSDEFSP